MALKINKCIFCGQLFQNTVVMYCPKCALLLDEYFKKARDYLVEHPGATTEQVVLEAEVPIKYLNYLIKSERLVRVAPSLTYTTCEICKKPVNGTRYCKSCQAKLANAFNSVIPAASSDPSSSNKRTVSKPGKSGMYSSDEQDS